MAPAVWKYVSLLKHSNLSSMQVMVGCCGWEGTVLERYSKLIQRTRAVDIYDPLIRTLSNKENRY
ncbi:MAG: hypothetical protein HY619_01210 [Thaumarchaeota archaeon]|nr:hypothetical protein [Nitrososphaerota archaeon]